MKMSIPHSSVKQAIFQNNDSYRAKKLLLFNTKSYVD